MTSRGSVVILNHLPKERFIVARRIHSSHIIYREDSPHLGAFCVHLNGDNCYTKERNKYSNLEMANHLGISIYAFDHIRVEFGEVGQQERTMKNIQKAIRRKRRWK